MLAAEWSSVAMRKLAAVCERAIGRTEKQGGEQPLKKVLLFVCPQCTESRWNMGGARPAAFDLVGFS